MFRHVGLVGKKHSGKTSSANHLLSVDSPFYQFQRASLAGPLKDAAASMMRDFHQSQGLDTRPFKVLSAGRSYIDTNKDAVFVPFLQWLGTDYAREFLERPNHWIDKFIGSVEDGIAEDEVHQPTKTLRFVCDDIRFINEAVQLGRADFLIVKIVRPEAERIASLEAAGVDLGVSGHSSETELDRIKPDVLIHSADDHQGLLDAVAWLAALTNLHSMVHGGAVHPSSYYKMLGALTESLPGVRSRCEFGFTSTRAQAIMPSMQAKIDGETNVPIA